MNSPDQTIRHKALNPEQSFIVQAPAGSGKTELLTQRFLRLLACVEKAPEEIVAITFTKKAASEMKARIFAALKKGASQKEPITQHEKTTWHLAKNALKQDKKLNWELLSNPQRLRVTTIDSLCSNLTRQMPVLAHFGYQPQVTEDASFLYKQAVQNLFSDLESKVSWQSRVKQLLLHLDNRIDSFERLLIAMLSRREQWLEIIHAVKHHEDVRAKLETALKNAITEILTNIEQAVAGQDRSDLQNILPFALSQLNLQIMPLQFNTGFANLPLWQIVADMFLTKDGTWRKSLTKKQGFPAASNAVNKLEKQEFQDKKQHALMLLSSWRDNEAVRLALLAMRSLPPASYSDKAWQIIDCLIELLPVLVAHLRVVFAAKGEVDFNEIALSALQALGQEGRPTDLALSLDYQVRHLLVDEFQDTSQLQFNLLEALTRGWQLEDGRSLFLVGDPMQSIYRFRQADVGLFMQAKQHGVGNLTLGFLRLKANFRSAPCIIDWINTTFVKSFPPADDHLKGAVAYSDSIACKAINSSAAVDIKFAFAKDEATQVVSAVVTNLQDHPKDDIAILVRSRAQLTYILQGLQTKDIAYQAIDIESLAERMVIQDCLSLTYALNNPADRLAWFAILRAPWCGLLLTDLEVIAKHSMADLVSNALQNEICLAELSADGQNRVTAFIAIMNNALAQRGRLAIRDWVANTWQSLNGPAVLEHSVDIENAKRFFSLLDSLCVKGCLPERKKIQNKLASLRAKTKMHIDTKVFVMTIHKAKGLEFDTVILPGLSATGRSDEQPLLLWQLNPLPTGEKDLLLAPIKSASGEVDPIYKFLWQTQSQKAQYENLRLLYVAATRAKQRLQLFASIKVNLDKQQVKAPAKGSLLNFIWPSVAGICEKQFAVASIDSSSFDVAVKKVCLERVAKVPAVQVADSPCVNDSTDLNRPDLHAHDTQVNRLVGTVVHEFLQVIAESDLRAWQELNLNSCKAVITHKLLQLGLDQDYVNKASNKVILALQTTLASEDGVWVLGKHNESWCEIALSCDLGKGVAKHILDRVFLSVDGTYFIVDYKTSEPGQNESYQHFISRETKAYQAQLERYKKVWQQFKPEAKKIRTALFFCLQGELIS